MEAGTNSLAESQQDIPGARETKLSGECFVPEPALSDGLSCFPNQMQHEHNDTNADGVNNPHSVETRSIDSKSNEPEGTNAAESGSKPSNKREVDDKCLDFLNPLSEDLEEGNIRDSVEERKHSQPLVTTDSTPPTDSHESAEVNWPQNNRVDDGMLPSTGLEQAIAEPIVESFYATMSQENKGKPVEGSCSDACQHETKSDLVLTSTSDEAVAMREMEELRAVDLQESQLFGMAVEDQASNVHVSSLTENTW